LKLLLVVQELLHHIQLQDLLRIHHFRQVIDFNLRDKIYHLAIDFISGRIGGSMRLVSNTFIYHFEDPAGVNVPGKGISLANLGSSQVSKFVEQVIATF
jgi:hypothetical protein